MSHTELATARRNRERQHRAFAAAAAESHQNITIAAGLLSETVSQLNRACESLDPEALAHRLAVDPLRLFLKVYDHLGASGRIFMTMRNHCTPDEMRRYMMGESSLSREAMTAFAERIEFFMHLHDQGLSHDEVNARLYERFFPGVDPPKEDDEEEVLRRSNLA